MMHYTNYVKIGHYANYVYIVNFTWYTEQTTHYAKYI